MAETIKMKTGRTRRTKWERRALYINPETIIEDLLRLANWKPRKQLGNFGLRMVEARKKKQKAALQRRIEAQSADWKRRRRPVLSLADRMVLWMQPGGWYGQGEIAKGISAEREARGKVIQRLLPLGLVEQARNSEPTIPAAPLEIMGGATVEPMILYRLTPKGEAWREVLRLID